MDEEEIIAFTKRMLETADPNYLSPPEEMQGKFIVCKEFQVIAIFETEEEAFQEAARHEAGSIEIRQPLPSDDGTSIRTIIPGAVKYVGHD